MIKIRCAPHWGRNGQVLHEHPGSLRAYNLRERVGKKDGPEKFLGLNVTLLES